MNFFGLMNYFNMLNINFYSEDEYQGDSILPFIGFWIFILGVLLILIGAVNYLTEKRDFKIFYDAQSLEEKPDMELKKKKLRKGIIMMVVGLILVIGTRIFPM